MPSLKNKFFNFIILWIFLCMVRESFQQTGHIIDCYCLSMFLLNRSFLFHQQNDASIYSSSAANAFYSTFFRHFIPFHKTTSRDFCEGLSLSIILPDFRLAFCIIDCLARTCLATLRCWKGMTKIVIGTLSFSRDCFILFIIIIFPAHFVYHFLSLFFLPCIFFFYTSLSLSWTKFLFSRQNCILSDVDAPLIGQGIKMCRLTCEWSCK